MVENRHARIALLALAFAGLAAAGFTLSNYAAGDDILADAKPEESIEPTKAAAEKPPSGGPPEAPIELVVADAAGEPPPAGGPPKAPKDTEASNDNGQGLASASGTPRIAVISMTSLANAPIGAGGREIAHKFTAEETGEISGMRTYLIANTSRSGYAAGDGGEIRMRIAPSGPDGKPDDDNYLPGSSTHKPNLSGGAGPRDTPGKMEKLFKEHQFNPAIPVVKGEDYFLVYDNIHPEANSNYMGVNASYVMPKNLERPAVETPADLPVSIFWKEGGSWVDYTVREDGGRYTPIMELRYSSGTVQGNNFMSWEAGSAFALAGQSAVRTTIKVPTDTTISNLAVRVSGSSSPVKMQIESLDGQVLRTVEAVPSGRVDYRDLLWAEGSVDPITLEANKDYAFVVRAGTGYTGRVVPLQAGLNYGFSRDTSYKYGVAQTSSDGQNWSDWTSGLFYFSFAAW